MAAVSALISSTKTNPFFPIKQRCQNHKDNNKFLFLQKSKICCFNQQHFPNNSSIKELRKTSKPHILDPIIMAPEEPRMDFVTHKDNKKDSSVLGTQEMLALCGVGYYVNGLRGLPWLALNFHMATNLNMPPSTLQIVQNFGNLPMVAKPLFGILSDAIYINGAHRIPYISIGVILQIIAWGSLALLPIASEARQVLMACVLLSNIGAAVAEVAKDALVAEYGQQNKVPGLQSYAFMASAVGGIMGNLLGGFCLLRTRQTKSMFLAFAASLALQLTVSLKTTEESLGLAQKLNTASMGKSLSENIGKQFSDLMAVIKEESIWRPLVWVVSSIVAIPMLSGSIFCYQTQCLNLDASVIGMSKVTGQLLLLSLTLLYNRFGKKISMRKLVTSVQLLYAFSLLLDLVLVKQINLQLGISNEVFALFFSGLAETIGQFKLLPFHVLFATLAPPGCEGSLMSFLASTLCLSSIVSAFFGVGLASYLGITNGNYSSLPFGICVQFVAALLPLCWISYVPASQIMSRKAKKKGLTKKTRKNRRVGRVVFDLVYSYRRERETDLRDCF